MIFDSKLSWRRHILEIKNKCKSRMSVIKVLSNIHWGANRDQLLKMVQCLIVSVLDYGCHLYGTARNSILIVLDPTSGFISLSEQRDFKSLLFDFKVREDPNSLLYKSLINSLNNFSILMLQAFQLDTKYNFQ